MKKLLITLLLPLCAALSGGAAAFAADSAVPAVVEPCAAKRFVPFGKIYITKNSGEAHYKVYVTKNSGEADGKIYITKNSGEARRKGFWYITKNSGEANYKVYFTKNSGEANCRVYFVNRSAWAGQWSSGE